MKKSTIALLLVLALSLALLAGCGSTNSGQTAGGSGSSGGADAYNPQTIDEVDWDREPAFHAIVAAEVLEGTLGYNSLHHGLEWAEKQSNGKFTFEMSLNGALVGNADMVDGLYSGIIQIGNGKAFINSSFAPELECLTYPGYYAGSWEDYPEFLKKATEACNEIYADFGLHEIGSDIPNGTIFLFNDVLIRKPEDMKGLIVRVSGGSLATSVEAWGGSPTVIALGDVATALERKTVDGMITGTGIVNDFSLYDISKNATFTTFHEGYSNMMCTQEYWDKLTRGQQLLLEGFVEKTVQYNYEETAKLEAGYVEKFKAAGCNVAVLTAEECAPFAEACLPLYEAFAAKTSEKGMKLLKVVYECNGWDWNY